MQGFLHISQQSGKLNNQRFQKKEISYSRIFQQHTLTHIYIYIRISIKLLHTHTQQSTGSRSNSSTTKMLPASGLRTLKSSTSHRLQTTAPTVCPLIHHHPVTELPEIYPITTTTIKALKLWKVKPNASWISQLEQHIKAVGASHFHMVL